VTLCPPTLTLVVIQLRYPIILSHVFVVVAFSSEGWSPEVRMSVLLRNVIANRLRSCASFLHPHPLADSDALCSRVRWTQVKVFLVWVSIFSGRLCWCLRTYALWNRPRWLLMLGLPAIGLESSMILYSTMKVSHVQIPTGAQQMCIASPEDGFWSIMAWVVPFSFDTTLSLLSIVRAMRVSRRLKTPLTTQLIRDGAQ